MPTMANITVTNQAAASVIYVAATASAGDRSPAVWRQNALSPIIGWRPTFTVVTRDNSNKNGRHFTATIKYPVVDPNGGGTGIPKVVAVTPFTVDGVLPTNVDNAAVSECFHQLGGLISSTLIRSVASEGYSPT